MASILVIDDEPSIRTLLRSVCESAGHTVAEATNGREGAALYRQHPVDLVITDIHVPEMNGLYLILELARQFLNVRVIAITRGLGEDATTVTMAQLLGARQTLQKPFRIETLRSAVEYELAQ
jgi:two-component system response regulator (stage 0 sporulation protein F)